MNHYPDIDHADTGIETNKYAHIDRSKPLMVVVDTSVLLHKLHQSIPMEHNDPQFESILKANLTWLMSGVWLGDELRSQMASMVFVKDTKPYWRSEWLADITNTIDLPRKTKAKRALAAQAKEVLMSGKMKTPEQAMILDEANETLTVKYKAGRKLPTYAFTKIRKLIYRYLDQLGANVLASTGYEADDMAAAIVQTNTDNGSPWNVLLLTVDTDWLGLVNPNVTWCCMTGFHPTIRDTLDVCNQWAEKRLGSPLETWRDIWDIKGEKGDASDNLPPSNGILLPVIDLLNPPVEHKYWLKAPDKIGQLFTPQDPKFSVDSARAAGKHLLANGLQPVNKVLPMEKFVIHEVKDEPIYFDLTAIPLPALLTIDTATAEVF